MNREKRARIWKTALGFAVSVLFTWLAFRRVDAGEALHALARAEARYLLPLLAAVGLGLAVRVLRWGLLLRPVVRARPGTLLASLSIGYMCNAFMPAHLGEFVRAWHAARRTGARAGAVLATIVVERIVDVASLLLLLALALLLFPFPGWVRQSGAVMLALVAALTALLRFMKRQQRRALAACERLLRFLPLRASARARDALEQFLCGVAPLQRRGHYAAVAGHTLLLWGSYVLTYQLLLQAFGFTARYRLPAAAALVVLVVTTISVVVPSSPGYIGTFHYLCQLSLGFFRVPKGPALSYAIVLHALTILPPFFLGLVFLAREKLSLRTLREEESRAFDR
jgi:hypothetical protein